MKKAFEEFLIGNNYVLRFYRVDHGLICSINESMVDEIPKALEQISLDAFNRGKMLGYAEGLRKGKEKT